MRLNTSTLKTPDTGLSRILWLEALGCHGLFDVPSILKLCYLACRYALCQSLKFPSVWIAAWILRLSVQFLNMRLLSI